MHSMSFKHLHASQQRTKFLDMRSSFKACRTPFIGCKQARFPHATSQHPAVHPLKIYTISLLRSANAVSWAGYISRRLHISQNRRASKKQCCVTRITISPNIQQTLSCRVDLWLCAHRSQTLNCDLFPRDRPKRLQTQIVAYLISSDHNLARVVSAKSADATFIGKGGHAR